MTADAIDVIRRAALRCEPDADGFGALLDSIGDARVVLVGEASHRTHEFYRTRAELTKALIVHEADWLDAYRLTRRVRHGSSETDAEAALGDFTRFPRRMTTRASRDSTCCSTISSASQTTLAIRSSWTRCGVRGRAGNRCHLPGGRGTREPLLPRAARRAVRRRVAHRRDACARAPGTLVQG